MRLRLRTLTLGMLALVARDVRSQSLSTGAAARVQVSVVIDSTGRALVRERYRVPRDTGAIQLQLLTRACASVGEVILSNYVSTFVLPSTGHAPWRILRDTTGAAYSPDSSGFDISYVVALGEQSVDIPLVQLTRPIPRREGEGEGSVSLSVLTGGRVGFPRLARKAPSEAWVGRFVAVPSFVHVDQMGKVTSTVADCIAPAQRPISDGGLRWRFFTLLAMMVAWVPLYLFWARRTQEGDA